MAEEQKSPSAPAKPGIFVRESTGLLKNASFLDAISIGIASLAAGTALSIIGLTMVLLPSVSGVNLLYGNIFGFVIILPMVIVYTIMTQRYPRSGGDYVFISRTLGGFVGSVSSFGGFLADEFGYLALTILTAVFAIGSVGLFFGNQAFLGLALPGNVTGSNPGQQFVLGIVIFAILIGVNIYKPKLGFRLVSACAIIGILTLLLAIIVLLSGGRQGVVNYMSSLGNANITYAKVAGTYSGPTFDLGGTIIMVPFFTGFIYAFINAGPAVASEIKGSTAVKWNVLIAVFLTFVLVTAAIGAMYYVGGLEFINSALSNPTLVYNYSFNFWTLAMGVANSNIIALVIGIGWIVWVVGALAEPVIIVARYLLAQSFDRFLPARMSYVSPKFGSPVAAHLLDLAVTLVLVGLAAYFYGTLVALYGTFLAAIGYYAVVGIAAAVHGLKKEKGGTKALLVASGVLTTIIMVFVMYEFLAYPAVWGINNLANTYMLGFLVLSLVLYLASKRYHAKRGIDIGLAFKQIPPE